MVSEPYFEACLVQKPDKKNIVDQNLEGVRACCAPLWIRHCHRGPIAYNSYRGKKLWYAEQRVFFCVVKFMVKLCLLVFQSLPEFFSGKSFMP